MSASNVSNVSRRLTRADLQMSLDEAIERERYDLLERMVQNGVSFKNSIKYALNVRTPQAQIQMLEWLLAHGAKVNPRVTANNYTPLEWALRKPVSIPTEVIIWFIEHGVKVTNTILNLIFLRYPEYPIVQALKNRVGETVLDNYADNIPVENLHLISPLIVQLLTYPERLFEQLVNFQTFVENPDHHWKVRILVKNLRWFVLPNGETILMRAAGLNLTQIVRLITKNVPLSYVNQVQIVDARPYNALTGMLAPLYKDMRLNFSASMSMSYNSTVRYLLEAKIVGVEEALGYAVSNKQDDLLDLLISYMNHKQIPEELFLKAAELDSMSMFQRLYSHAPQPPLQPIVDSLSSMSFVRRIQLLNPKLRNHNVSKLIFSKQIAPIIRSEPVFDPLMNDRVPFDEAIADAQNMILAAVLDDKVHMSVYTLEDLRRSAHGFFQCSIDNSMSTQSVSNAIGRILWRVSVGDLQVYIPFDDFDQLVKKRSKLTVFVPNVSLYRLVNMQLILDRANADMTSAYHCQSPDMQPTPEGDFPAALAVPLAYAYKAVCGWDDIKDIRVRNRSNSRERSRSFGKRTRKVGKKSVRKVRKSVNRK